MLSRSGPGLNQGRSEQTHTELKFIVKSQHKEMPYQICDTLLGALVFLQDEVFEYLSPHITTKSMASNHNQSFPNF